MILKNSALFVLLLTLVACGNMNSERSEDIEDMDFLSKAVLGTYLLDCRDSTAADGGPISSTETTITIFEGLEGVEYKEEIERFDTSDCSGEISSFDTVTTGTMMFSGTSVDITSENRYSYFGHNDFDQTIYTTMALEDDALSFVRTRHGTGKTPETRLDFSMIQPLFTFKIELRKVVE